MVFTDALLNETIKSSVRHSYQVNLFEPFGAQIRCVPFFLIRSAHSKIRKKFDLTEPRRGGFLCFSRASALGTKCFFGPEVMPFISSR
jgi:hypothetical protein